MRGQRDGCSGPFSHQLPPVWPDCHQPETCSWSVLSSISCKVLPCQCWRSAPQAPASDCPSAVRPDQRPSQPWLPFSARHVPWRTICPAFVSVHVPSPTFGWLGRVPPAQVPCSTLPLPAVAIQVPRKACAGSWGSAHKEVTRTTNTRRIVLESDLRMAIPPKASESERQKPPTRPGAASDPPRARIR
jgi:hypothetical protein